MPGKTKKLKIATWILLGLVVIFGFAMLTWLYGGMLTQAKIKVFRVVPLPMALVNYRPLPMKNFLIRFSAAEQVLGGQAAQQQKLKLVDQLVQESEISQLASERDAYVSQNQIGQEYALVAQSTNLHGSADFASYLKTQGLDENLFKQFVLKPELEKRQLEIWFNGQAGLNPESYQEAQGLLQQLKSGKDMAALATQFTQDSAGKSSGGDMGFLQITDLAPELRETVGGMKMGDVKIIPGQSGLHIIKLEGQVGNQLHLRQIFLQTSNFNDWLSGQTKSFKVINLLKI